MAVSAEQKRKLLAEHFLLRHLSGEELDRLIDFTRVEVFDANQTVFSKGDDANCMMVVISGNVQVSAPATKGDDIVFAAMRDGDVFGEVALVDGYSRSANAVAAEKTELLILDREDFIPLLENNAKMAVNLLKVLCRRIRRTNALLEDFSYLDLRRRLAKRLIYLSDHQASQSTAGMGIKIRVHLEELVAMMGVNEIAIQQQLELWRGQGLIDLDEGWIVVNDGARLTEYSAKEED